MSWTRPARFGVLLTGSTLVLAACGAGGTSTTSSGDGTVRVIMNNTNDALDIVVADQQGFFKKHGLKVATTTTNDISQVPSLLGKQYDIGFSVGPIMIRAASAGVGVVAISGNDGDSPSNSAVQVFARKGITDAKQLAGKRIGSPTLTGNINIATKAWLAGNGVDPGREQFVQVATPNMLDELKAGQVDAVELIHPFITLAKQAGFPSLGDPERALSGHFLGGTYWTADAGWAKAHPKTVSGFRAALGDADRWIEANQAAAYRASAAYTKVPPAQARLAPLGPYTTDVSVGDLKIWGDAMREYGDFAGTVDYSRLVPAAGK